MITGHKVQFDLQSYLCLDSFSRGIAVKANSNERLVCLSLCYCDIGVGRFRILGVQGLEYWGGGQGGGGQIPSRHITL